MLLLKIIIIVIGCMAEGFSFNGEHLSFKVKVSCWKMIVESKKTKERLKVKFALKVLFKLKFLNEITKKKSIFNNKNQTYIFKHSLFW